MIKEVKTCSYHSTLLNEDFNTPFHAKAAELNTRIHIRKNVESLIDIIDYYNELCDEYKSAVHQGDSDSVAKYEQLLDETFNKFYEVGVHKLLFPENEDAAEVEFEKAMHEHYNESDTDDSDNTDECVEDVDVERAPSGGILVRVHKVKRSHCGNCNRCKQ